MFIAKEVAKGITAPEERNVLVTIGITNISLLWSSGLG